MAVIMSEDSLRSAEMQSHSEDTHPATPHGCIWRGQKEIVHKAIISVNCILNFTLEKKKTFIDNSG